MSPESGIEEMMHHLFFVRWVFVPLWVFHGIVSRGRFSMPAPTPPRDRHVRVASFVIFKIFFCVGLGFFAFSQMYVFADLI